MDVRFHPLTDWPRRFTPADKRKSRWSFRASWADTLNLLDDELQKLDARDIVIAVALEPGDIRIDGWPRSNAREPRHPGVILSFTSKHGPLQYATDVYEMWQHNVRAIALGLQALRAVDRYGITSTGEQYTGWKALGTGNAGAVNGSPGLTSKQEAERLLCEVVGEHMGALPLKSLYRQALVKTHPDRGGDAGRFAAVRQAGVVLGLVEP